MCLAASSASITFAVHVSAASFICPLVGYEPSEALGNVEPFAAPELLTRLSGRDQSRRGFIAADSLPFVGFQEPT